jgi:hypothetical protein
LKDRINRAFILIISAILFMNGCGGSMTHTPDATASLRVLQVNASAGTVDVLVDSAMVSSGLQYLTDTGYLTVKAGARQLVIQNPGSGNAPPWINNPINLGSNTKNTFILGGWGVFQTTSTLLVDDTSPPANSGIKLRVADVAARATVRLDVYLTPPGGTPSGSPLFSNLGLSSITSYQPLAAGSYDIFFTTTGTTTTQFHTGTITFTAGQNRTLVLMDDCQPATCGTNVFRTVTLPDLN